MSHHKELSGALGDAQKWAECFVQLASKECPIQTLRIYHNTSEQLTGACKTLCSNNSVQRFEVGQVAGAHAAAALGQFLQVC